MKLFCVDSLPSRIAEAVAVYCGLLPGNLSVERKHTFDSVRLESSDPSLQKELRSRVTPVRDLPKGYKMTINHPRAICRVLARAAKKTGLLGEGTGDAKDQGVFDETFAIALAPIDDAVLSRLDKMLIKGTFLGGNQMNLGDIAVYVALYARVAANPACVPAAVRRWFDFVQNDSAISGKVKFLPNVAIASGPSPLFAPAAPTGGADSKSAPQKSSKGGSAAGVDRAAAKAAKKKAQAAKKAARKAKLEAEARARAFKEIGRLNLIVGLFKEVKVSPGDTTLYVSQIQVSADGAMRTVVSRIAEYIPASDLRGNKCVLIANLPEAEFGGVVSQGRVLCATDKSDKKKKAIVAPPQDAKVGERVAFKGAEKIEPDKIVPDKKLRSAMKKLAVIKGTAMYSDLAFNTSAGVCTCGGVQQGTIA